MRSVRDGRVGGGGETWGWQVGLNEENIAKPKC